MNDLSEALKGFTDLPIALLAFLFAFLLKKRGGIKGFDRLFFLLGVAAFSGAAVHIFDFGAARRFIWIGLYALLFETVRRFAVLFTAVVSKQKPAEKQGLFFAEAALYAGAILFLFWHERFDMLFFIGFGALCLGQVAVAIVKARGIPKKCVLLFCILPILLLLQLFSKVIPFAVVFEHLLIAGLLFSVYRIALEK